MEDKDLMENHLCLVKGICDLYLHGQIESTTQEVHEAFQNALTEELNIQNKIYNLQILAKLKNHILLRLSWLSLLL